MNHIFISCIVTRTITELMADSSRSEEFRKVLCSCLVWFDVLTLSQESVEMITIMMMRWMWILILCFI
jgi:hypothetical protein